MVRPAALLMGVVMLAVAVCTYYGLAFVPAGLVPGVSAKATAEKPSKPAAAAPEAANAPMTASAPAAASAPITETEQATDVTMTDEAEMDDAMAVAEVEPSTTSAPSAGTGAAAYGSSEAIERALANEPPPEEESVDRAARKQAKATPAPTAKEPAATKPAPAPVAEAQPKPEPEPVAAAKAQPEKKAEPAAKKPSEPTPKPAATTEKTAAAAPASQPKPTPSSAVSADALRQWWPDPSTMPANQLKLVYAGQVQRQLAIAVLFSDALDLETLKQNTTIKDDDGKTVPGNWEVGNNPKLAIVGGLKAGRYTLVLGPAVAGGGFMLGRTLQGPVYVKAP